MPMAVNLLRCMPGTVERSPAGQVHEKGIRQGGQPGGQGPDTARCCVGNADTTRREPVGNERGEA